jgi:hypothetical protein
MKLYLFLIILSFLTKSALSQQEESYFPLAVGNSWEYDWDDGLGGGYTQYVSIISKILKPNGKFYYLFVSKGSDIKNDSGIFFYRLDDSSNVYRYYDFNNKERLTEKLDAKIDQYWMSWRLGNPNEDSISDLGYMKNLGVTEITNKPTKTIVYGKFQRNIPDTIPPIFGYWASITFAKGIGIYSQWYEAYTRVRLKKAHIILGVGDQISNLKTEEYKLSNNYPNPFNPTTNIQLSLKKNSIIDLIIFDMLGKKICTLYNGEINKGEHIFSWDGRDETNRNVPSGVYYCCFNVINKNGSIIGNNRIKMILLR